MSRVPSVPAPVRGAALDAVQTVRVGSTNPPKLDGVRAALAAYLPEVRIEGVAVESGVSEQPLGYPEITAGARNRAAAARASGPCELGVGYEDGLVDIDGVGWVNVGCAAVHADERVAVGFSSGFAYPPACTEPAVRERAPIGDVFDRVWRARYAEPDAGPSGRGLGNVGKLTEGVLTRAEYTRHAVLCALTAFLHPDLYSVAGVQP